MRDAVERIVAARAARRRVRRRRRRRAISLLGRAARRRRPRDRKATRSLSRGTRCPTHASSPTRAFGTASRAGRRHRASTSRRRAPRRTRARAPCRTCAPAPTSTTTSAAATSRSTRSRCGSTATPELLDPCGGVADIAARRIRVLHDAFVPRRSDTHLPRPPLRRPPRSSRSNAHTARLCCATASATSRSSAASALRRELELIFAEDTAGVALEACQATGVLRATHPALRLGRRQFVAMTHARRPARATHAARLRAARRGGIAARTPTRSCARLRLKRARGRGRPRDARRWRSLAATLSRPRREAIRRRRAARPLIRPPPSPRSPALRADAIARQLALRYLDEWRHVKPMLTGRDLQELGVPAGPQRPARAAADPRRAARRLGQRPRRRASAGAPFREEHPRLRRPRTRRGTSPDGD